jgi:hypothetical protein
MKCFVLAFITFSICCTKLLAQVGASYPDVQTLRTALSTLANEKPSAFQNIKGSLRYKKGTVAYYNATVHIVKADTPKICEDTNPLQAYYLDFLAKEMTEPQSKEAYAKWQNLMLAALPGYTKQLAGKQYPDLESMDFVSPNGSTKFTLYRNGSGAACQVSVTIVNANLNELIAAVVDNPKKPGPLGGDNPSATRAINKDEFSRQLKELLGLAKASFRSIKGAEEKTRFIKTFGTSYTISGATKALVRDEDVSMNYLADYGNGKTGSEADALFEQLRALISAALPASFTNRGIVADKDGNKTLVFSDKASKQKVTLKKSDYLEPKAHYKLTLSIEQYSYWLD